MEFEVLKEKAKKREIKLEDLEVEDILKFDSIGFPNPTLQEYFGLSEKEVKRIRRQKGINDFGFENLIRDIIVFYNYFLDNYDYLIPIFINLIPSIIAGYGTAYGKEPFYLNKIKNYDWNNLDPKKEIAEKNIDIDFRLKRKRNPKLLKFMTEQCLKIFPESIQTNPDFFKHEYNPIKKERKDAQIKSTRNYPRNTTITQHALEIAGYRCEVDPTHQTFISRYNNKKFLVGHHLIPLNNQDDFTYSLDVEPNIICLCSKCHDEIHYGVNYKKLIKMFYEKRKDALEKCGLSIELEQLYELYDKKNTKEEV